MQSLVTHFQTMAKYNTGANQRLYAACAQLSDADYRRERPGSFHSIHLTLNHILFGDRIWMARFTDPDISSTPGLRTELYGDFGTLRAAREREDARMEEFVRTLEANFPEREIRYINNAGKLCADPFPLILAHVFNHQTHHRAQILLMLGETPVAPPSLDMHRVIRP